MARSIGPPEMPCQMREVVSVERSGHPSKPNTGSLGIRCAPPVHDPSVEAAAVALVLAEARVSPTASVEAPAEPVAKSGVLAPADGSARVGAAQ